MIRPGSLVLCGALALVASACGGDGGKSGFAVPEGTGAASAVTSPSATSMPSPSATAKPKTAADEALAAAVEKYNALVRAPGQSCGNENPLKQSCVSAGGAPASPDRGVAVFSVSDAGGMGGFIAVFGRRAAGDWDLWFGTQNTSYHVFNLPAAMLVCADGDGVNVRKAPGSDVPIVTLLKDLTQVQAEEFVLTAPATNPPEPGTGWYRISSPNEGWVHSSYVSDAQLKDCSWRDALEKKR